jgi:hypothetical protein
VGHGEEGTLMLMLMPTRRVPAATEGAAMGRDQVCGGGV